MVPPVKRASAYSRTAVRRFFERRPAIAPRAPRYWLSFVVPAIACVASLITSNPAEFCKGQKITLAAAPPPTERSYNLYLKQSILTNNGNPDLLLIGDSLAEGWDNSSLPALKLVNLGVGGDKVQNVLWRLDSADWSTMRPSTVLIMLGTNNLADDPPCAVVAGLKKLSNGLSRSGRWRELFFWISRHEENTS